MKISGSTPIHGVYNNYNKVKPKTTNYAPENNLDIEISQTGKDFSVAMEKLKNLEPIRQGKVENIKKQISNGTYVVDSTKIARAMLLGETND